MDQNAQLSVWLESYPALAHSLEACSLRFINHLPDHVLREPGRLVHQLGEAFHFYSDNLMGSGQKLPRLNRRNFILVMMEHDQILRGIYPTEQARNQAFQHWRQYMAAVPVRGAILLNESMDKTLMVMQMESEKWGFPKGKVDEGENDEVCAVREVWEEAGVDIKHRISPADFVEADLNSNGVTCKLFIVANTPESGPYAPKTRKEIGKIGWVRLKALPGWTTGQPQAPKFQTPGVQEFIPQLKHWVETQQRLAALGPPPVTPVPIPGARPAGQAPAASHLLGIIEAPPGLGGRPPAPPGGQPTARLQAPPQHPPPSPAAAAAAASSAAAAASPAGPNPFNMARIMAKFDESYVMIMEQYQ